MKLLNNRPLLVAQEEIKESENKLYSAILEDTLLIFLSGIIEKEKNDLFLFTLRNRGEGINRVVLAFDSPGGYVEGIQEVTKEIKKIRESGIEIVAVADPLCCSGAYWIASASDYIFLSSSTSRLGSVGVIAVHEDISEKEAKEGKVITEIVAGKYKKIDSKHRPLSSEGHAFLQSQVDYVYSLFCNEISENRNILIERVTGEIGTGQAFIGAQAVENGLADGIFSLNDVLEREYMSLDMKTLTQANTRIKAQDEMMEQEKMMEYERLKKENEELKKEIEELKKKIPTQEEQTKYDEEKKEMARVSERNRIKALEDIAPANCQTILSQAKSEGWTVEKAAIEFLKISKIAPSSLRAESQIVPSLILLSSDEKEREEMPKRMSASVNKSRIRS